MTDIKKINGYEILNFLNNLPEDDHDELVYDYNLYIPFIFEKQEIVDDEYRLTFSVYYNNWGTHQLIEGNVLRIGDNHILMDLEEAFEGSGTDDTLIGLVSDFLKSHTFNENIEEVFYGIIEDCRDNLNQLSYPDKTLLEKTIEQLTKAYTMIK